MAHQFSVKTPWSEGLVCPSEMRLSDHGRLEVLRGGEWVYANPAGNFNGFEEALAREVLRLALREAALLTSIESQRGSHARAAESQAQRIADLESERVDLISERDGWRRTAAKREQQFTEKEHQLALAKAQIAGLREMYAADTSLLRRTAGACAERQRAAEADNRAKCLELAEKAETIRHIAAVRDALGERARLGDALASVLSNYCGERGASEGAVETLERIIEERDAYQEGFRRAAGERAESDAEKNERIRVLERRLEDHPADRLTRLNARLLDAIEDGIAHVEKARGLLNTARTDRTLEQLDLAHEVLSKASQEELQVGDPAKPVADLEARVNRLLYLEGTYAAHAARLAALEEKRADTAILLVDHADRLKAAEHDIEARLGPAVAKLIDRLEALEARLADPIPSVYVGDAVVIEKRRHERTGSPPAHFYACGPVRETLDEAIADANRLNQGEE